MLSWLPALECMQISSCYPIFQQLHSYCIQTERVYKGFVIKCLTVILDSEPWICFMTVLCYDAEGESCGASWGFEIWSYKLCGCNPQLHSANYIFDIRISISEKEMKFIKQGRLLGSQSLFLSKLLSHCNVFLPCKVVIKKHRDLSTLIFWGGFLAPFLLVNVSLV